MEIDIKIAHLEKDIAELKERILFLEGKYTNKVTQMPVIPLRDRDGNINRVVKG